MTAQTTDCYWVHVFSIETWREFLAAGAKVTGFRPKRWKIVSKIRPGDRLLCYVSKVGTLIAATGNHEAARARMTAGQQNVSEPRP